MDTSIRRTVRTIAETQGIGIIELTATAAATETIRAARELKREPSKINK